MLIEDTKQILISTVSTWSCWVHWSWLNNHKHTVWLLKGIHIV